MALVCPSREELSAFSEGRLPDELFDSVANHVETCASCLAVLDGLGAPADSLLDAARHTLAIDPYWDEPECRQPVTLAEPSATSGSTVDLSARPSSTADTGKAVAKATSVSSAPGAVLGNYEILGVIRDGGMGVVYRARHCVLGHTVALKMIKGEGRPSRAAIDRFLIDARTLAQLRHEHIIRVHDFDESDGQPYFTMDLAERGSLEDHLAEFQKDEKKSLLLMAKVARAVHHVHEHKIVHRDLKPSNILLEADDKPVVSDFGLAKWLEDDAELTHPGDRPGTAPYMAPERFARPYDPPSERVDIWALGVILYELVVGRRPFLCANRADYHRAILKTEPPPPRSLKPRMHRDLETIILKCLDKNPSRRYATADDLAEDLERRAQARPIYGRRVPFVIRICRYVRQHAVFLGLATLAVAIITLVAIGYAFSPERLRESALRDLRNGKGVQLLGLQGTPPFAPTPIVGKADSAMFVEDEGHFSVSANSTTLVTFLPQVPLEGYRISADIRHEGCREEGAIGLFFGHRAASIPDGTHHFYYELSYSDIKSITNEGWPLCLRLHYYFEPREQGKTPMNRTLTTRIQCSLTPPNLDPPGPWRTISVELDSRGIRVLQREKEAGFLSTKELHGLIRVFRNLNKGVIPPELSVDNRGSMGVFIHRGVGSFRSFDVKALPAQP